VGMAKARNKQLATGRAHHILKTTFLYKKVQKGQKVSPKMTKSVKKGVPKTQKRGPKVTKSRQKVKKGQKRVKKHPIPEF